MHPEMTIRGYPHMGSFVASVTGAVAGAGVIYALGVAGKVMLSREAMGFGDVKLMAMIGAFLGWQVVLFVLFFSAFIAIGYGLVQMASTGDNKIPYGPFLSIAAAAGLLFRPAIDGFVAGIIASYGLLL